MDEDVKEKRPYSKRVKEWKRAPDEATKSVREGGSLVVDDGALAADRFLFSFESYLKLTASEKRRWVALAKQIEVEPLREAEILRMLGSSKTKS